MPEPLWKGEVWRHDKPRIAYLSADFREHATAYLMAGLFERHDRSRFEITAVSFGADDRSAMRSRLVAAFEQFIDVRQRATARSRGCCASSEIDIAVDLKGHTQAAADRHIRAAPGAGAGELSRLSGHDGRRLHRLHHRRPIVSPFDRSRTIAEKIVHLPDSYQVNDRQRRDRRAHADARRGRPARAGLRVLLVQQQLQDHARGVRRLDAAAARGRGQRAVAAARQRSAPSGNLRRRRSSAASIRRGWCSPTARRRPSIWRAIGWPTCSSTRCPATRTPPRATRCGRACRC